MKTYIPYIIIAVLLAVLVFSSTNKKNVVVEKAETDTIFIEKIDTVVYEKPIFIKQTVVDTFIVKDSVNNQHIIQKIQRYYRDSIYEAWVSGYRPNLDSIHIFRKTIINTITNTITKEIYPKTTDLYMKLGFSCIGNKLSPVVGLNLKLKNDMIWGGELGYYDKKIMYGLNFGFKINNYGK